MHNTYASFYTSKKKKPQRGRQYKAKKQEGEV